jgi:zinc protease
MCMAKFRLSSFAFFFALAGLTTAPLAIAAAQPEQSPVTSRGQAVKGDTATAKLAKLDAQTAGITSYLLPNGFKIILAPYPSAANARIELLVKTGSKLEGYGETGMAHLLEHMLFKSAGKRTDIKADLTALGATWNGTTSADRTNFFETVAAEPDKVDAAIRIEADRFIRASFTKQHLLSEMTVVRNELERNDTDPNSVVMRALQQEAYAWHGYARPTLGARSDIEDAPFEVLQAFHKKHYRPDNAALIVTGNFDPQRVLALAASLFAEAKNPAAPKITSWTREESRATTNRAELTLPAGMTLVTSGWKLPGITDRRTLALDLGSSAICDNDWGSLRKDLVLERKVAVAAMCGTQVQNDYGLFLAKASGDKDADAEALSKALREHIEKAAAQGISQAQLERARQAELNAYETLENSHEQLASQLSQAEIAGDWRLAFWQRDMVKEVTLDEVNAALKTWLVATNRSDVLLRHADGVKSPELPKLPSPAEASKLVEGKQWAAVAKQSDPIPSSATELAKATITLPLSDILKNGTASKAALIARKTQGERAWLVLANDYGNEAAMTGRDTACSVANNLVGFGGAGMTRDQLDAKLEALQATWSVNLGGLSLEVPRKNFDAAVDILLAAWAAPTLPQDEFERMKAGAISNMQSSLKDPSAVASTQVGLRFDNYPANHPLKPQSLEAQLAEYQALSYADVSRCASDLAGVANVRLGLVGTVTPQDVKALAAKLAKLPVAKTPYQRIKAMPAPSKAEIDTTPITVAMPEKPNASIAGSAVLALTDEADDFPALRIAIKVLGGDAESRIWKRLREKEGLAYGAGVSLSGNSFEPRSSITFYASAASSKADAALTSLKDELASALKDGLSEEEVARAKRTWLEERKSYLRNEKSFASSLANGLYTGHDYAWLAAYDQKISQLSREQVNAALRKWLNDAAIVWSVGRGN